MAIREGRWDCSSCGSTRIYGRHVDCPGCGRPRPAGVRFYLAEGEPAITSPEQLREASAGPDWVCGQCGASNRAGVDDCGGCGAPRGGSPTQPVIQYAEGAVPRAGGPPRARKPSSAAARGTGRRATRIILVMVAAFFVLPVSIVIAVTRAQAAKAEILPAQVGAMRWERGIHFAELRVLSGEGWTLPDSAEVIARERRVRRTERQVIRVDTTWRDVPVRRRVLVRVDTVQRTVFEEVRVGTETRVCGSRDLGNGYFEDVECSEPVYDTRSRTETDIVPRYQSVAAGTERRMSLNPVYGDVPVHDTWYTYRTREWGTGMVLASGPPDSARAWPALPSDTLRETGRFEGFSMDVRDARGREHRVNLRHPDRFARYRPGQRVALRTGPHHYTDARDVLPPDSLPECRRWHAGKGNAPPDSLGCTVRAAAP